MQAQKLLGVIWLALLALALAGCHPTPSIAMQGDRLRLDARINDQPARLIFDTGADSTILLRPAAARLGLKVSPRPSGTKLQPGQVWTDLTEPCRVDLLDTSFTGSLNVYDAPAGVHPDSDGVLGWENVRQNVLIFELANGRVTFARSLPEGVGAWLTFPVLKDHDDLGLAAGRPGGPAQNVMIDTGDPGGVGLAPEAWLSWRAAHPQAPVTLTAYFMPGAGLVAGEECWADEITLGTITLRNVPVTEASPAQVSLAGSGFSGVVGLYGLSRFSLVVDGKWSVAYFHASDTPPRLYKHNRLGAVFVPQNFSAGGPLLARVLRGSPAAEAGIRDGDELLKVDQTDATHWHDPGSQFSGNDFWEKPAGTKLELTIQRDGQEIHATAVLRDLIGPEVKPPAR